MTENEEGTPFFPKYAHLVPTAKSLAPESEEDELSSSDEDINKEIDTKEFILELQKTMNEVILKLLERPTRNRGQKQRRKNLREKEAKHLTEDTEAGNIVMRNRAASRFTPEWEHR